MKTAAQKAQEQADRIKNLKMYAQPVKVENIEPKLKDIMPDHRADFQERVLYAMNRVGIKNITELQDSVKFKAFEGYLQHQSLTEQGLGQIDIKQATGRAYCRITGNKIPKGHFEMIGFHDFHGGSSYTSVECHIDLNELMSGKTIFSILIYLADWKASTPSKQFTIEAKSMEDADKKAKEIYGNSYLGIKDNSKGPWRVKVAKIGSIL